MQILFWQIHLIFQNLELNSDIFIKNIKELSVVYARLINQNKFKYHNLLSASFYKINEKDQISKEIELYININNNHDLTDSDIDNIDGRSISKRRPNSKLRNEKIWLDFR